MDVVTRWFLVLELALSGCSLTLSGPAAHRPRNQLPACDTGKSLVVVDALIATTLGLVGIGEASSNATAAILPVALGAAFVGSALYGNAITTKCGNELNAYNMEMAGTAPAGFVPLEKPVVALPRPRPVVAVPPPPPPPVAVVAAPPAPPVEIAPPPPTTAPVPTPPRVAPVPPRPTPAAEGPWQEFWQEVP